jgi:dihydrofolate reductase
MNIWLIAAMSADGKIAQSQDQLSLDWTSKEDTRFFVEKTKEAGVVIMGRKTFDTIGKPLKGRRIIVMTRQPDLSFDGEGVEYTTLQPRELVIKLESEGVSTLALAGGSMIYGAFLQAGLVTDLYLTIEPVMFGGGVPLASGFERIDMKFVDVTPLNDQAVLLYYKI